MRLKVVFFGMLQRLTGCREVELEISETNPDVNSAARHILQSYPAIEPHIHSVAFSVGDQLVDRKRTLHEGDELGILPPVSGG